MMPATRTAINRRPIEPPTAAPTMVFDETPSLAEAGGEVEPELEEESVSLGGLPLDVWEVEGSPFEPVAAAV